MNHDMPSLIEPLQYQGQQNTNLQKSPGNLQESSTSRRVPDCSRDKNTATGKPQGLEQPLKLQCAVNGEIDGGQVRGHIAKRSDGIALSACGVEVEQVVVDLHGRGARR